VFGVSGAAALYRRAMLKDVRVEGVFAESFFLYLEDVDLDWRARLRGWKAYCVPMAVAYHERGNRGGSRRRDPAILRHTLKNRYLMMLRNDAAGDLAADLGAIFLLEPLRFLDFLVTAPCSLVGYLDAVRLAPRALRQRRRIRAGVRVPRQEIRHWLRQHSYRRQLVARARRLFRASDGA
jgi:GT2 family glycosyltransferase